MLKSVVGFIAFPEVGRLFWRNTKKKVLVIRSFPPLNFSQWIINSKWRVSFTTHFTHVFFESSCFVVIYWAILPALMSFPLARLRARPPTTIIIITIRPIGDDVFIVLTECVWQFGLLPMFLNWLNWISFQGTVNQMLQKQFSCSFPVTFIFLFFFPSLQKPIDRNHSAAFSMQK